MPTLHNREREITDRNDRQEDREISLGTGTILAIFFALTLLCAVFFGFGYSMGRKSAQPAAVVSASEAASASAGLNANAFKPSAVNPGAQKTVARDGAGNAAAASPRDPDAEIVTSAIPADEDAAPAQKQRPGGTRSAAQARNDDAPAAVIVRQPARPAVAAPATTAMPASTPSGTAMVQIAAVSHQEDADVLISALKKRGYAVFIRQEPQDRLLHVQVGPFASRKDADLMRQRLLADGYNAIVK